METSKEQLLILREKRDKAVAQYQAYLKQFNEERKIQPGQAYVEIIDLHKQGLTNKEIADKGYSRNYVNQQVTFFKNGKRIQKTTVSHLLPKKKK